MTASIEINIECRKCGAPLTKKRLIAASTAHERDFRDVRTCAACLDWYRTNTSRVLTRYLEDVSAPVTVQKSNWLGAFASQA